MTQDQSKFRYVNATLGTAPSIGPIAGNQLIPWALLAGIAWFFGQGLLGLGVLKTVLLTGWLIGSWSLLTGTKPSKFLSKFTPVPYWACSYVLYRSLLLGDGDKKENQKNRQKASGT